MRFLLLLLMVASSATVGWAQSLEWSFSIGDAASQVANDVATPVDDSTYVVGHFLGNVDFDPGAGNAFIDASGTQAGYLAAYDDFGSYYLAVAVTSASTATISAVAVDSKNDVFVAGTFENTLDAPGVTQLSVGVGNEAAFVAKFDPQTGNFLWAEAIDLADPMTIGGIATDGDDVYVIGTYVGANPAFEEVFVRKYNGATGGAPVITGNYTGNQPDYGLGIVAPTAGAHYFIVGLYKNTIDFGNGVSLSGGPDDEGFLAKFEKVDGDAVAAIAIQGTAATSVQEIVADGNGDLWIAGHFSNFVTPAGGPQLSKTGNQQEIFFAKYDNAFNYQLAGVLGANGDDVVSSLAVDASERIYIAGQFSNTIDLDPGGGTDSKTPLGVSDLFVSILDTDSNYINGFQIGGAGATVDPGGITTRSGNRLILHGSFDNAAVDFDPFTVGSQTLSYVEGGDVFVEDLSLCLTATADAGSDALVCFNSTHQLAATAMNATAIAWSTSGSGTFNDASLEDPIYTFSAADIAAGTVTLTMSVDGTCNDPSSDVVLTIDPEATADAGSDALVCFNSTHQLAATATNGTILWTTSGSGTFDDDTSEDPIYTFSAADIAAGTVTLTMSVDGSCNDPSDAVVLTIDPEATADAGSDALVCFNSTHQLAATATNGTILWTTSGSGTFDDDTSEDPIYTFSAADIAAGTVTLTMSVDGSCNDPSDAVVLTIDPEATADAGSDALVCFNSTHQLAATATNGTILWTTSGSGTFDDDTAEDPIYTFSAADIAAGTVTLTMSVDGSCNDPSDAVVLTIDPEATADAGSDALVCFNSTHQLAATATNGTILWTTSGSGTFDDDTAEDPIYTFSAADIAAGTVTLTMSVDGSCNDPSDAVVLTVDPEATADAGSDALVCFNSTHQLAATATNGTILWTTSGSGTFDDDTSEDPIYTFSAADIAAGTVTLTMSVDGSCNDPSDAVVLTVDPEATADAGSDALVCFNSTHQLAATATNGTILWTTSGSGTFDDDTSEDPIYTFSAADIAAGTVTLTMSVDGSCNDPSDAVVLTIDPEATADAGSDALVCFNSTHQLAATATNGTILWTTSGSGAFDDDTSEDPIYTFSAADIAAGTVTLTMSVDGSCNDPSDAVVLTIDPEATADAGSDALVCFNSTHQLAATATNGTILWTTSGSGTFDDDTSEDPIYTFSAADIAAGTVTLTMSVDGSCNDPSDAVVLTIDPEATADAGSDALVCFNSTHQLAATATNGTILWTTSGSGTFDDDTSEDPIYTFSAADIAAGTVTLTMSVDGSCNDPSDAVVLTIDPEATADAGSDALVCFNSTHQLAATATNGTILWTTSGSGTFDDDTSEDPIYTFSAADIAAGTVTLTMSVDGTCNDPSDAVVLTIDPEATADAGSDALVCFNSTHQLAATATNGTILWTTSGSGTFDDDTAEDPIYTFSAADIAAGMVTLTMSVDGTCNDPSSDVVLTIDPEATADAGSDALVCYNSTHQLAATATNGTILWTTSGSGTFDDDTSEDPIYTFSAADIAAGTVTLTMSVDGSCNDPSDAVVLTIDPEATADAGSDALVCFNSTHQLAATATNGTILWTTSGSGTFDDDTAEDPIYTFSAADIAAGTVTLTMSVDGSCNDPSDAVVLTIDPEATADAGSDALVCFNSTHQLAATATNGTILWTTSGSGTFDDDTSEDPIYTFSAADIAAGTVTLTMSVDGSCNDPSDAVVLTIDPEATADAGSDALVCFNSTHQLAATATNGTILWTTSGSGTFDDDTSEDPIYTFSAADIAAGTVTLTMSVDGSCNDPSDAVVLTVDPGPTTPTIDFLTTNDPTPEITGTADAGNTLTVLVAGATYTTVADGNGDWLIDTENDTPVSGTFNPDLNGTNEVGVTASDAGCDNTDVSANELTIDTTDPAIPTVNSLVTNDDTPELSGEAESGSTVTVTVAGATYTTTSDGTWTVDTGSDTPTAGAFSPVVNGTNEVEVTSTDAALNSASDVTSDELEIDQISPGVTINELNSSDATPLITGTVDDSEADIEVTVDGQSYPAVVDGVNWSAQVTNALSDGTYNVAVTATDEAGNVGTDSSSDELVLNGTSVTPTVTINSLETFALSPALSGDVDDADATIEVAVDGQEYDGVNNGDGTWSLDAGTIVDLEVDTYDVAVRATSLSNLVGTDNTGDELRILPSAATLEEPTEISINSFKATWSELQGGVTSYVLEISAVEDFSSIVASYQVLAGGDSFFVVPGLRYSTNYYVRVQVLYGSGDVSEYSNTKLARTLTNPNTEVDSLALVAIYDETGGDNWTQNTNWKTDRLDTWFGVTVEDGRVTGLDLSNNNLSGAILDVASGLGLLRDLNLSSNELTGIGNVEALTSLETADVTINRLPFGAFQNLKARASEVIYANQGEVLEPIVTLEEIGTSYEFDRQISGTGNVYKWFKDETRIARSVATFSEELTSFDQDGVYHVEITNAEFPDLTLISSSITLKVSSLERDGIALLALYNATGGDFWTNGADWPNNPNVDTWEGVTVSENRVTGLDLKNSNLVGTVPAALLDIINLQFLDLSGNFISGIPDLTRLEDLTAPNVSDNLLDFADLEVNATIPSINYLNQKPFGDLLEARVRKGATYNIHLDVGGSANTYSWEFVGKVDGGLINENSSSLQIKNLNYENMGDYTLIVESTLVPDLKLRSEPQTILAITDMDISPVYFDRDGKEARLREGEAFLYEVTKSGPFDTIQVETINSAGIKFKDVVLGDYLVSVRTDTLLVTRTGGQVDSVRLLPTYYSSSFLWEEAETILLREKFDDHLVMQKKPTDVEKGGNEINLLVESDFESEDEARVQTRRKVKRAGCSLRRRRRATGGRGMNEDEYELIAYKETDDDGRVTFPDLPDGFYKLNIEYPGVPMDPNSYIEFEIGEGGLEDNTLTLEATVDETGIAVELVEVLALPRDYLQHLEVYPNPVVNELTVKYSKRSSSELLLIMTDLNGKTVYQDSLERGFDKEVEVDVSAFNEGIYLLRLYSPQMDEGIATHKLVISRK